MRERPSNESVPQTVFRDAIVQLAALCPICALSALDPVAALAALSPVLNIVNPAVNPGAALLAFLMPPQQRVQARAGARIQTRMAQLAVKHTLRRLTR